MHLLATAMVFLLQTPQAPPQTSQPPKASIEGFAVRAGTNEPIARARITVNRTAAAGAAPLPPNSPSPNIPTVTTDNRGHFLIKDLDAGAYLLTAQRNGFARQAYGERAAGRPGTPMNVIAGQALTDIVFRLTPAGAIGGRVSDATGEPLAGITVQVLRSSYDQNGKRTFQTVGSGRSNDRGEYRVYWITPGRYYVNATPIRSPLDGLPIAPNSNEVVEPGYVLTYYPGTTDPSTASAVEVPPAGELSTIDFTLTQQQLFRVRGRIFDTRTNQAPRSASVSIYPRNPTGGIVTSSERLNYNSGNGTFELRDVAPGSYWVRVLALPDPGAGLTTADIARNTAQVAVDVSNADVENIVLALTGGFSLRGRVELENGSFSALSDIDRTRVYLFGTEPTGLSGGTPQLIKPDGTFILENVQAGDYGISMQPMPPNTYFKSVRLGQTDVSAGISISGPLSEALEIMLGTNPGQIDGTIVDKEQKPMRGVQAILIPDRQRNRRDQYRFANSDQNGRFTMRTVAPGDYKLFAWEDLEPGAYNDPDFLRKYEGLATPVKVSESGKLTVEAKMIPAGR